jgi:hypothetical protein
MALICRPARVRPNVITFRKCTHSVISSGYSGREGSLYGPRVIVDEVE